MLGGSLAAGPRVRSPRLAAASPRPPAGRRRAGPVPRGGGRARPLPRRAGPRLRRGARPQALRPRRCLQRPRRYRWRGGGRGVWASLRPVRGLGAGGWQGLAGARRLAGAHRCLPRRQRCHQSVCHRRLHPGGAGGRRVGAVAGRDARHPELALLLRRQLRSCG